MSNNQKTFASIASWQHLKSDRNWLSRPWRLAIAILGIVLILSLILRAIPVVAAGQTQKILSTPANVIWGELFKPDSKPIARVKSGDRVVMETVSHEGILPDQGDTIQFFAQGGIPQNPKSTITRQQVLSDQLQGTSRK